MSQVSWAEESTEKTGNAASSFSQTMPAEEKLADLFSKVKADPQNLDINFEYAQLATAMGKNDEAMAAYERMLIVKEDLPRVKLDMGLLHLKMGNAEEAEKLFSEVMESKDLPTEVKENVELALKHARKAQKKHSLALTIGLGFNNDTNANAAPGSNAVDVGGLTALLDDTSRSVSDDHIFVSTSLAHNYRVKKNLNWLTTLAHYRTKQSSLRSLDLTVKSIKFGPQFTLPKRKTRLTIEGNYSDVNLAGFDYQRTSGATVRAQYMMDPRLVVTSSLGFENRRFSNSPSNTTYELRNGYALNEKVVLTFTPSKKNLINFTLALRQENTTVKYNDNHQSGATLAYTRILPKNWFVTTTLGLKKSQYKREDTFVNPNIIRRDLERSFGLVVGKKLTDSLSLSMSYQQRDIFSTLQNYEYKNERVGISLSWKHNLL